MKFRTLAILVPTLALACQLPAQTPQPGIPKIAPGTPATPAVSQVPESAVVLTVGSVKMTRADYENLIKAMPEQVRTQALGPAKHQMVEKLVEVEVLAQEARKRKIDQRPEAKEITAFQVNTMLAGFLYQDLLNASTPDDAALHAYYDEHKKDYEQAKIRHILIRYKGSRVPLKKDQKDLTPEEALAKAQDIHKKLAAGEDFGTLAKSESDDAGSAGKGGEFGFVSRDQLVPEFANPAFALPIGQISEPVKTMFGYHIIKVDEHRTKPFEEVKESIEKKLRPELAQKKVDEFRKQIPTEINESYFGK